jgi:hypothetical protein
MRRSLACRTSLVVELRTRFRNRSLKPTAPICVRATAPASIGRTWSLRVVAGDVVLKRGCLVPGATVPRRCDDV